MPPDKPGALPEAYSGPRILIVGRNVLRYQEDDVDDEDEDEKTPGVESGGQKGVLVGLSKQSRLNLAKKMAQVSSPDVCYHLTVTYGAFRPCCREELDRDKELLRKRASQLGLYGFWRLEFQRSRGDDSNEFEGKVPHFHCLLYVSDPVAIDALRRWWRRRTRNESEQGFWVTVGNEAKAAWYMALHNMKMDQTPPFAVGRWWGMIGKTVLKSFMRLERVASVISGREIIWLKRLMRRKTGTRGSLGEQGFSWFLLQGDHARVLLFAKRIVEREHCERFGKNEVYHPF